MDSQTLHLRIADSTDAPDIATLVNGAYRGDSGRRGWTSEAGFLGGQRTDAEAIAEVIRQPSGVILLLSRKETPQTLLACVHLQPDLAIQDAYLGMLTVQVDGQGGGVGDYLLKAAETFARENWNARTITLTVIDIRPELIAWYERRGYRATGETRPFPYGNERFGIPLRDDLQFRYFKKQLSESSGLPAREEPNQ